MDSGVRSDEHGWRKGPWTPEEDKLLSDYIGLHGDGRWTSVATFSGNIFPIVTFIRKTSKT